MGELPLYIAEMRACLAEIREHQEQLRARTDLTREERADEIDRITRSLIRLHQEWCEMLEDMSRNRMDDWEPVSSSGRNDLE
jgi:hypothetical protein